MWSYKIGSHHMMPTLLEGDRVAFRGANECGRNQVTVGDIVSYRLPPSDVMGPGGSTWIGRIVAGGGQTVRMAGGVLHIDGAPVSKEPKGSYAYQHPNFTRTAERLAETLPNGRVHETLDVEPNGHMDDTPLVRVPPDHWFIMGDNRDISIDSRLFGSVPTQSVCGVATKIVSARDRARIGKVR